jgi:hypothetical protein
VSHQVRLPLTSTRGRVQIGRSREPHLLPKRVDALTFKQLVLDSMPCPARARGLQTLNRLVDERPEHRITSAQACRSLADAWGQDHEVPRQLHKQVPLGRRPGRRLLGSLQLLEEIADLNPEQLRGLMRRPAAIRLVSLSYLWAC